MQTDTQLLADIEQETLRTRQRTFALVAGILIPPTMWYMASADFAQRDLWEARAKTAAGITMAVSALIQYRPAFAAIAPRISLLVCILPLLIAVFGSRGHQALLWHALFPVLCTFLFGRREGLVWSAILFLITLPIVIFHQSLGLMHLEGFEPDYLAVYLCLTALAYGWEAQGARVRSELARERDALAAARQKQADYASTTSDWFFELDAQANVTELSGNWEDSIGIPVADVVGESILLGTVLTSADEEERDELEESLSKKLPFRNIRRTIVRDDGSQIHLQVSGLPVFNSDGSLAGYRGSGTNITGQIEAEFELVKQQEALRRSERLNAIGQLTSGIAHDFNNVLTVVRGNLELMRMDIDREHPHHAMLEAADNATQTAADLTHSLLSFGRQQPLQSTTVDLPELLGSLGTLLPRSLPSRIQLEIANEPGIWNCRVDRSQLESALVNLVINARDAIDPDAEGSIRLVASNVELSASDIPAALANQMEEVPEQGRFVCLEVSDTGCGMHEAMFSSVFEPFYTTKSRDQGTGLGLSMVHGFTYQSGGYIEVHSTVGLGTCISLYLPAEPNQESVGLRRTQLPKRILVLNPKGRETMSLSLYLQQLGCEVTVEEELSSYLSKPERPAADVVVVSNGSEAVLSDVLENGVIASPNQVVEISYPESLHSDEQSKLAWPFGMEELGRRLIISIEASSGAINPA